MVKYNFLSIVALKTVFLAKIYRVSVRVSGAKPENSRVSGLGVRLENLGVSGAGSGVRLENSGVSGSGVNVWYLIILEYKMLCGNRKKYLATLALMPLMPAVMTAVDLLHRPI